MSANIHRGEIAVTIGGAQRVLRPDFTAMQRIETETGKTVQELTARAIACSLGIGDMAIILHCGLVSAGGDETRATVGQWMIDGGGAVEFYQSVGKFLVFGLTGGRDADPDDDAKDDDAGEPMPERVTRSGGWRRWLAGVWGGLRSGSGNQPRTN